MKNKILLILASLAAICGAQILTTQASTTCLPGYSGGTGICTTASSTVGQSLVVSSTDANGYVTWKLAAGSGGSTSSTVLYPGYMITAVPNPINTTGTVAVNTSTLTSYIATLGYLTSASGTADFYPLSGNPSNFTTTTIQSVLNSLSATGLATYNSSTGVFNVSSSILTPYLTTASATALYYPLTNPSGYLSSSTGLTYFFPATTTIFLSTTTGNWVGTWQGNNSTTFYLASNPSGYLSSSTGLTYFFPATTTIFLSTTTGNWIGTWQNKNSSDFLSSSTTYVATNTGDWAGTWQTHAPSYFQTALGFTPYNSTNPSAFIPLTALSGTAPITYNSGTGAIGITQAGTGANGYLSSTDWNTFNGKGSGTVTGIGVTTANGISGSSSGGATPSLTLSLGAITPTTVNGLALSLGANSVSTNVAVGNGALASGSLSGGSNTANGYTSLHSNTTGNYNTANGMYSLYSNTTGNYNTANGYTSLNSNTTGGNNTANGDYSLFSNTTGNSNTANGYNSLYYNTTSSNSVALGFAAGYNSTIPNAFYVGNVQQSSAANDQNYSLMYGTFAGSAGTISGQTLMVNGELGQATAKSCTLGVVTSASGQFSGCVSSDEKLKTDITNFGSTLATGMLGSTSPSSSPDFAISMINELNPVTYNWISTSTHGTGTHLGFIAEQVQQVDPDAVSAAGTNASGTPLIGVDSNSIGALLTKGIQELYADFTNLAGQVSGLATVVQNQQTEINQMQAEIAALKK